MIPITHLLLMMTLRMSGTTTALLLYAFMMSAETLFLHKCVPHAQPLYYFIIYLSNIKELHEMKLLILQF